MYLLTQKGIAEKARLTAEFFKRKTEEYEELQKDLRSLKQELRGCNKLND